MTWRHSRIGLLAAAMALGMGGLHRRVEARIPLESSPYRYRPEPQPVNDGPSLTDRIRSAATQDELLELATMAHGYTKASAKTRKRWKKAAVQRAEELEPKN